MGLSELYKRIPGTPAPTRQQCHGAWAAVSTLRQESDHPLVVGAYTAAEWTLQLTDVRPIARDRLTDDDVVRIAAGDDPTIVHPAEPGMVGQEILAAIDVLEHRRAGDDGVALGVYVWLAWWAGQRDLPEQFIPASDAFEHLRAG
jgi:hypothetical protein